MKIEAPSENKIVVDLTTQDMAELDITYEEMDYSNIETRRVIWTLLDKAGQELGRDIDPTGRMMIEAIPKVSGGCIVHFTILCEEKLALQVSSRQVVKKELAQFTYEFHSIDDLLDCARRFQGMRFPPVSSALYENGGVYRLLLGAGARARLFRAFFSEYGQLCGEGACGAAATREHWRPIVTQGAIEQMAP